MSHLTLSNGDRLPALGLGTWKSRPGEVYEAVLEALRLGYRHLDCAAIYGNEAEIGRALADSIAAGVVRREEVWLTSKLWNDAHAPADVEPALRRTLQDLQTPYLDLYLIHWPICFKPGVVFPDDASGFVALADLPLAATWGALEPLRDAGLVRHLGVSNLSVAKLADLLPRCRIRPEVNQVELHPYLQQPALAAYCRAEGIHLTAYSPLGSPDRPAGLKADGEPVLLTDPVVTAIAGRLGASPAQVLLAWALAQGHAVIPKSVNPARLAQNLEARSLSLSAEDLAALAGLDRHRRYVSGDGFVVPGGPVTLANLWDE